MGIFVSGINEDFIADLDEELGLRKLKDEAQVKLKAEEESKNIEHDQVSLDKQINYSLDGGKCTDVEFVRNHVESSGEMEKLIDTWTTKTRTYIEALDGKLAPRSDRHPGCELMVVVVCAMTLGCTLKEEFLDYLRSILLEVGPHMLKESLKEMDTALNSPHGFQNGRPYKWGYIGVHLEFDFDDFFKHKGFNLPHTPTSWRSNEADIIEMTFNVPQCLLEKIKARMEARKQEKPAELCGRCGRSEGNEGEALLQCGACKSRKYCGRDCQKKHWKTRKLQCAKPPSD